MWLGRYCSGMVPGMMTAATEILDARCKIEGLTGAS